jgi:hypothetical protein
MGDLFPKEILDNEDYGADYMRKLDRA